MELRSFLLPTTATLSLSLTPGCGPAGDWQLESTTVGEVTNTYPLVSANTWDATTYTTISESILHLRAHAGEWEWMHEYTTEHPTGSIDSSSRTVTYEVVVTPLDSHRYEIQVVAGPYMLCLDGGEVLSCEAVAIDGTEGSVLFERL